MIIEAKTQTLSAPPVILNSIVLRIEECGRGKTRDIRTEDEKMPQQNKVTEEIIGFERANISYAYEACFFFLVERFLFLLIGDV